MGKSSLEYNEMTQWLGGGNRLASAMHRVGVRSMAKMDELYTRLGEKDFTTFLWEIPNIGAGSVPQILGGLQAYRTNKNGTVTPVAANAEPFDVWTRNDSPEWLARNSGCSDVLLAAGLPFFAALGLAQRIREMYGDDHIELHPSNKPPQAGTVGKDS